MIHPKHLLLTLAATSLGLLSACTSTEDRAPARPASPPNVAPQASLAPPAVSSARALTGWSLDPDKGTATAIAPGIGECELVRLKGKPPTDVLVGEGRSGREVQVLYNEPGAKELYFFVNNKLDRIVK